MASVRAGHVLARAVAAGSATSTGTTDPKEPTVASKKDFDPYLCASCGVSVTLHCQACGGCSCNGGCRTAKKK